MNWDNTFSNYNFLLKCWIASGLNRSGQFPWSNTISFRNSKENQISWANKESYVSSSRNPSRKRQTCREWNAKPNHVPSPQVPIRILLIKLEWNRVILFFPSSTKTNEFILKSSCKNILIKMLWKIINSSWFDDKDSFRNSYPDWLSLFVFHYLLIKTKNNKKCKYYL
jgi:hypothetical protein